MAFRVVKNKDYNITIIDSTEFLEKSILTKSGSIYYTQTECFIIDVLIKVDSSERETIVEYAIGTGINSLTTKEDGLYKIVHIIIPNSTWYNLYSSQVDSTYDVTFVADDDKIYKKSGEYLIEIPINELLLEIGNLNKELKYTFSSYNISLLFVDYTALSLKDSGYSINRDLVKMFIDCIRYCLTNGKYFEALRYVDKLYKCKALGLQKLNKHRLPCGCLRHRYELKGMF